MSPPRFWPGTSILNMTPRPREEQLAELADLAQRAAWGDDLAEVIDLARSPLPDLADDDEPSERDPIHERIDRLVEKQLRRDLALLKTREMVGGSFVPAVGTWLRPRAQEPEPMTAAPSGPRRKRALTVDVEGGRVLLASGEDAGRAAWQAVFDRWLRAPSAAPPGRRRPRIRVDVERRSVTAAGRPLAGGWERVRRRWLRP